MANQVTASIMPKIQMLNMDVSVGKYWDFMDAIISTAEKSLNGYVCVANVHMLVEVNRNIQFARIINNATIVTPDGKPLTWAFNLLHGMRQERVAGMDLLPDLINAAIEKKVPVFFYGGSPLLLSATEKYLHNRYRELIVSGFYSPPFRDLTADEEMEIAKRINDSKAKLVFVVLGCPKQEKWMSRMKDKINATMIGVGAALPVFIGQQRRAPKWMQDAGLEWFYRMLQEPRRLFKRYAVTNSIFCFMLLKAWAAQGFSKRRVMKDASRNNLSKI